MNLTGNQLQHACGIVRNNILSEYEDQKIITHLFSEDFSNKISVIQKKIKHHYSIKRLSRTAAAVIITLLVIEGVVLSVNVKARDRFINWIVSFGNKITIFQSTKTLNNISSLDMISVKLKDSSIPLDLLGETEAAKVYSIKYQDELVLLTCVIGNNEMYMFTPDNEMIPVIVNGQPANYYIIKNGDDTNELYWTDENFGILINLSGKLSQDEMIQLAERILVSKKG